MHENVRILRCFPLSQAGRLWSVRSQKGEEIGVVASPADLPDAQRAILEEELQRRYMVPEIRRILELRERFDTLDWVVETDRGAHRFTTRQLRENISQPSASRYLITDVEGRRFDIPELGRLPLASQALFLRML